MVTDSELYVQSKIYVKRCFSDIYNKSEHCVIVSISRKGPKLLEFLLGSGGDVCNTITEVALPFYALRHMQEKKHVKMVIFDDAIYYGTTAIGIYKELCGFERLYGLDTSKELYTAIRSKESKSNLAELINEADIHSYNDDEKIDLRHGYGHYFIRRLEEDMSQLHNTLEVEFPIVEFMSDKPVNESALFHAICGIYGDDVAFEVTHYKQTSISIVLGREGTREGQSFRKLRIYVDGNIIRVVCLAPWLLPDDMSVMPGLFGNTRLKQLWGELMQAYQYPMEKLRKFKADYFISVERCIRKSLVIMANYFFSYRLLLEEKEKLLRAFSVSVPNVKYKGVCLKDLFYLLGDAEQCDEVRRALRDLWDQTDVLAENELIPNINPVKAIIDYQVFENEHFPEIEEQNVFERHNKEMLENCQNVNEALSAMFFNQTSLIEKWSRRSELYDFGRLRFGYTFMSLYNSLMATGRMELNAKDLKKVDQWIDHRIDQACIVPQYVVDRQSNLWCRVFRPGENEDALLSHLARYVLSVFKAVDEARGLGWVYENHLREMLCLSAMDDKQVWQKNAFEFQLVADRDTKTLKFKYDGEENERDVLDYIIAMHILKQDQGVVSISSELVDDEIGEVTTLDEEVEEEVTNRILMIEEQIKKFKFQNFPFFVTNLYFIKTEDFPRVRELNRQLQQSLDKIIAKLEQGDDAKLLGRQLFKEYYQTQDFIIGATMLVDNELLAIRFEEDSSRREYIREMVVLWMLKSIYELLIVTFLREDDKYLRNEVENGLAAPLVYGYPLSLSQEESEKLQTFMEQSVEMDVIRKLILPIARKHIEDIPKVNI